MNTMLKLNIPCNLHGIYQPIGVVRIENGCCPDKPVLITVNAGHNNKINYSCQCACDLWCTNGHSTASAALKEYEEMTRKYKEEQDD